MSVKASSRKARQDIALPPQKRNGISTLQAIPQANILPVKHAPNHQAPTQQKAGCGKEEKQNSSSTTEGTQMQRMQLHRQNFQVQGRHYTLTKNQNSICSIWNNILNLFTSKYCLNSYQKEHEEETMIKTIEKTLSVKVSSELEISFYPIFITSPLITGLKPPSRRSFNEQFLTQQWMGTVWFVHRVLYNQSRGFDCNPGLIMIHVLQTAQFKLVSGLIRWLGINKAKLLVMVVGVQEAIRLVFTPSALWLISLPTGMGNGEQKRVIEIVQYN